MAITLVARHCGLAEDRLLLSGGDALRGLARVLPYLIEAVLLVAGILFVVRD